MKMEVPGWKVPLERMEVPGWNVPLERMEVSGWKVPLERMEVSGWIVSYFSSVWFWTSIVLDHILKMCKNEKSEHLFKFSSPAAGNGLTLCLRGT